MRDVVVIGNGPGGSVAAMTARKHYKDANVTLVKRERDLSFNLLVNFFLAFAKLTY